MDDYQLLLDVWEGSMDVEENVILSGGVTGLIIRLNDMNGGHHLDNNFYNQWRQAERFPVRSLYFVYNPWVSGKENFRWLKANVPSDTPYRIFPDVEVRYADYPPNLYAYEVQKFINYTQDWGKMPEIYTGEWFLPYLSKWPINVGYWWARYLLLLYPPQSRRMTYEELHAIVRGMAWNPAPSRKAPGPVKLWQASGDRLKLPGCCDRAVDVNIYNGSLADLQEWIYGVRPVEPPPPQPEPEQPYTLHLPIVRQE